MNINYRLKALRETSGMTLEEVAKIINVTKQTVQKYESGVVVEIPSDRIEALAEVYNVSPGYIMGWEDLPKQNNGMSDMLEGLRRSPGRRTMFSITKNVDEKKLEEINRVLKAMVGGDDVSE